MQLEKTFISIGNLEISWWKSVSHQYYILPAIHTNNSGNTTGFMIRFLRYVVDFAWFKKNIK